MRNTRVYFESDLAIGREIPLGDTASHHLGHVLRAKQGRLIHVFNGTGGYFEAEIISINRKSVLIRPLRFFDENRESLLKLTLAQGISRGPHMDYTVQKAVELGVTGIIPLFTEFSNVRLDRDRSHKRFEHWRRIIIGACEQSGRNIIPDIAEPVPLMDWINTDTGSLRLVLHPEAASGLSAITVDDAGMTLLCGPEGGLSEAEVESALATGYQPVSLGPRILRTETAALAAIAVCQSIWGDL